MAKMFPSEVIETCAFLNDMAGSFWEVMTATAGGGYVLGGVLFCVCQGVLASEVAMSCKETDCLGEGADSRNRPNTSRPLT